MAAARIVVIGTSAGGIEALQTLCAALPSDFRAPVCVVMHISPDAPGVLPAILGRTTKLRVLKARNGARLTDGTIYIAPADCHLLVEPGLVRVTKGPKENRFRPAIDPLFRSAAQVYGPAAIGVVLTGNLGDGTSGLWAIKRLGGVAIVQDPEDAMFPSMPRNAIRYVDVDHVVPLTAIGPLLVNLTTAAVEPAAACPASDDVEVEVNIAKGEDPLDAGFERIARPSPFACPDCHGVLMQLTEGDRMRFRCHTGHAYSIESLLTAIHEGVEGALWASVRAMHEAEGVMQQMAEHLTSAHGGEQAAELQARARALRRRAEAVRGILTGLEEAPPTEGHEEERVPADPRGYRTFD